MTLCPIALAVTCKRCAAVGWCPVKGTLGDYVAEPPAAAAPPPKVSAAARKPRGHKAPGRKTRARR